MDVSENITRVSEELIDLIKELSFTVKRDFNSQEQKEWLKTLLGFKENFETYNEVILGPDSITSSMSNIVNNLSELSDEDRNKFITKEQFDQLKSFVSS